MKKLATAIAAIALIGTPAFAADMPVKAPPPAPAPVPTWTGFYGGIQVGGAWLNETVIFSPNDAAAAAVLNGTLNSVEQPAPNNLRISQSGVVGGVEAGYNWQWSNWLVGLETDFSFADLSGSASGTSFFAPGTPSATQLSNVQQSTDWFGTVRGRIGWLPFPNFLLFGTGGFAYGRVHGSAIFQLNGLALPPITPVGPGVSANCFSNVPCFSGSSGEIRTGWAAGGGFEVRLDQRWSWKAEYQFVDLGTQTVRVAALLPLPGTAPASFNAPFHDRFSVVRVGLNYRFW